MKGIVNQILGIAVFVTAVLLWKPATLPKASSVDESKRGVYFALAKSPSRIIASGEHGRILYSNNNGKTWSSGTVPVDIPLTGLFFLNDYLGWAVGYEGLILKSEDGALSWTIVREPSREEPPLFDIWFKNNLIGLAVGADSTIYRTIDGGAHWDIQKIEEQAHLYAITQTDDNLLWITGENDAIYNSRDDGQSWQKITPPFATSFFGAMALPEHKLLTFGLRGRISVWNASGLIVSSKESDENISAGTRLEEGGVVLMGQRGRALLRDSDEKIILNRKISPERDIAAVVEVSDALIVAGDFGLVRIPKLNLGH